MSAEEENLPDKAKTASVATDKNDIPDKSSSVVDDLGKRTRKLTAKGFTMLFENLQKNRKSQFMQANKIKQRIKEVLSGKRTSQTVFDVKKCLSKYTTLCNEALETQTTLLEMPMPDPEHDKQQHWLAQKIEEINIFENDVKKWLADAAAKKDDENLDVLSITNSDIRPEDSISNVSSKGSKHKDHSSVHSKASSIIYVRLKAKAERAALLQSAAALRKMHDIDAEEEALQMEKAKLKRKKEQLEVEAKLAAATARLSVFENVCGGEDVDEYGEDNGEDAMNAYLHAHLKSQTSSYLNTAPVFQLSKTVSLQQDHSQPLAVRPKGRPHIPQAQSSVRSGNPLSSVSYAPSSHRSEVRGNVLGTRPINAAPAGLQPSISQGSRPAHMHEPEVQGNGSRLPNALAAGFQPLTSQGSTRMQSQSHHHSSLDNVQHPTLYDLMQQQTNITAQLVQNQALASLPPRAIPEFDGDPLKYAAFIRAFEQAIEKKTTDKQECLYYLEQHTRGQPRELVRSCYNMASGQGYERAKNLLKEHFGNEMKIAAAYMEKAMTWPMMRVDDINALQSFSIFLRDCCNVMEDLQHMEEMNVPSNLRLIMMKLSYKLREKWRSVAWELQERRGYRAMFPDFVAFIERQVKILSDPLFGDLQGMPPDPSSKPKSKYTGRGQATVAAIKTASGPTTSAAWHQQRRGPASQKNDEELCCVCKSQHSVEKCSQLDEMTHREKLDALKVGRVCFSCLRRGHMSRECDKPLTCDICKHKHPTVLHIESKTQEVSVNNALASLETCGHTGAGSDECVLSIVPVQVKAKSGSTIVNTYAFLDPGSSASFCTQHLMRKLNLSGVKTSILLRTLGQERSIDTFLLSGLEVFWLEWRKLPGLTWSLYSEDHACEQK